MIKMKKLIFGLTIFLLSLPAFAQQPEISVSADTNAILIGEQVRLDIKGVFPLKSRVSFPSFKDTLTSLIEIVSASAIDTAINKSENTQTLSQQLIITSFDTGYHVIPPLAFGVLKSGDVNFENFESQPLLLNVFTVEVDTTKEIKPIADPMDEPYTFKEFLPYIGLALLLVALILGGIYFYRRWKKNQPLFVRKEKPALPPHEQALLDLQALKQKKLWQNDRLKEYHTELTDIVRIYIEGRFNIAAVEMVTSEIMESLRAESVNSQVLSKIKATFELADLVKFAKSGATALENDTSFNNCFDFVQETKMVIPEPMPEKPETNEKEVTHVS